LFVANQQRMNSAAAVVSYSIVVRSRMKQREREASGSRAQASTNPQKEPLC
jgi:hypothetical protein